MCDEVAGDRGQVEEGLTEQLAVVAGETDIPEDTGHGAGVEEGTG